MGRRRLVAAVACVIGLAGCGEMDAPVPSSILLVTLDTTRADHLGCYGYFRETTPVIDALAREAILFENVVSPMSTTLPAHVSLFTGTRTLRHGIQANAGIDGSPFVSRPGARSLAEMLAAAGYRTAAFVSASTLKDHTGIQQGFETFDQPEAGERRANATTDAALDWLATRPAGPFFLWVHYFDPHAPYDPLPEFRDRFTEDEALERAIDSRGVSEALRARALWATNRYDGEVLFMDAQLGRLFDGLREAGVWTPSAVVLTGDHGEGLGQHDWLEHGRIYNEQLFVPLLIKLPGGRGGGRREAGLAGLIDVVPTLTLALDLPIPLEDVAQFQGRDLLGGNPREYVLSERVHRDRPEWEPGRAYALTGLDWKLLREPSGIERLHDMTTDRGELHDVSGEHPHEAARLRRRLDALLSEESGTDDTGEGTEIPAERLRELRDLGYVD